MISTCAGILCIDVFLVFCKFEPVHCFIAGLGRLDFLHIHLLLTLKFIKCAQFTSNTVFKSLVGIHMQSSAFSLLLKSEIGRASCRERVCQYV